MTSGWVNIASGKERGSTCTEVDSFYLPKSKDLSFSFFKVTAQVCTYVTDINVKGYHFAKEEGM